MPLHLQIPLLILWGDQPMPDEKVDKRKPTIRLEQALMKRVKHLRNSHQLCWSAHIPNSKPHLEGLDLIIMRPGHNILRRRPRRQRQIIQVLDFCHQRAPERTHQAAATQSQ